MYYVAVEGQMSFRDMDNTRCAGEMVELIDHADTPAGCRSDCRTLYAQFGERPDTKNQQVIEDNIANIGNPQTAHGDGGIACTAENAVDDKQEHNHGAGAEQNPGISCAAGNRCGFSAHQPQDILGKQKCGDAYCGGCHAGERNYLYCSSGGGFPVLFTDSPGNQGGGCGADANCHGVNDCIYTLGEAYDRNGIGAQAIDKENIHYGKDTFHHHLKYHRHAQQEYRLANATCSVVLLFTRKRLFEQGIPMP